IGRCAGLLAVIVLTGVFGVMVPSSLTVWIRMPLLIIAAVCLGRWTAQITCKAAFPALLRANPGALEHGMQCQETYLLHRRCRYSAFGADRYCRWHKIVHEFRSDLAGRPRLMSQFFMFGANVGIVGSGVCLWQFSQENNFLWIVCAMFMLSGGIKYFSDAMI